MTVTGKDGGTIDMPLRHTRVSTEISAFDRLVATIGRGHLMVVSPGAS